MELGQQVVVDVFLFLNILMHILPNIEVYSEIYTEVALFVLPSRRNKPLKTCKTKI